MTQLRWETDSRYYAARIYPDLLGDWVVERAWGGLKNNLGNVMQEVVPNYSAAMGKLTTLLAERNARNYVLVSMA